MEFVRDWRRQAARAVGATALAPAVLLIAAVLLAAGGGLGGLGSLGQVAAGPSVPPAELAAAQVNVPTSPSPAPEASSGAGETPRSTPTVRRAGDRRESVAPVQRREPADRVTVRPTPAAGAPGQRTPSVRAPRPSGGNRPFTPSPASPSPGPQAPIPPQVPEPRPQPRPGQLTIDTKTLIGQPLPPPLELPRIQIIVNLPLIVPR